MEWAARVDNLWERSLENRQNLIPRKRRQGARLRPSIEDEFRGISHRRANAVAGYVNLGTGADGMLDLRSRYGCQKRAGGDGPKGIETKRLTEQCPCREHWKLVGTHAQSHARGLSQFPQTRGHATLGRIMHGMHLNSLLQHLYFFDYADAWSK